MERGVMKCGFWSREALFDVMKNKDQIDLNWSLPNLVSHKITNHLCEQKTYKLLREVSKEWNKTIDSSGALHLVLNEFRSASTDFLRRLPKILYVRVESVRIWKDSFVILGTLLKVLKIQCGITTWDFPIYLQKLSNLTSLTLEGNALCDFSFACFEGKIIITKMLLMFNLKNLSLSAELDLIPFHIQKKENRELHKNFSENVRYLLKHLYTPSLETFEIVDYVTCVNTLSSTTRWEYELIPFIAYQRFTLQKLTVVCSWPFWDSLAEDEYIRSLPTPTLLTEITLRFRTHYVEFFEQERDFWTRLLLAQSHLTKLEISSLLAAFPVASFQPIIVKNEGLLKEMSFYGLALTGIGGGADYGLENCGALAKLKLGLVRNAHFHVEAGPNIFDIRLETIPTTIQELQIVHARLRQTELQFIPRMQNLQTLELIDVDYDFDVCMDVEALKKILRMRSLNHLNISTLSRRRISYTEQFVQFAKFCEDMVPVNKYDKEYEVIDLTREYYSKVKMVTNVCL